MPGIHGQCDNEPMEGVEALDRAVRVSSGLERNFSPKVVGGPQCRPRSPTDGSAEHLLLLLEAGPGRVRARRPQTRRAPRDYRRQRRAKALPTRPRQPCCRPPAKSPTSATTGGKTAGGAPAPGRANPSTRPPSAAIRLPRIGRKRHFGRSTLMAVRARRADRADDPLRARRRDAPVSLPQCGPLRRPRHRRAPLGPRSRAGKLIRQGSPQLRWALYESAQAACRPTSPDWADYLALKARGLSHTRASRTIAPKLARRRFHTPRELGPEALEPIT